jgi:hypothetical protein
LASPEEALLQIEYDGAIRDKLGGSMSPEDYRDDPDFGGFDMETPTHEAYEDERNPSESMHEADDASANWMAPWPGLQTLIQ